MPIVRRLLALWIVASLPALAEESLQRGDFDQAIKYLDTYLTFNADSAKIHLMLSWACLKKGDRARALEESTEAIRLDPTNPDAYGQRAACYAARADYVEAIRDCCEALQLAPDHAATLRQQAYLYHETKQYAETLVDYEALLRLDPKDANTRLQLVDLLATCPDRTVRDLARAEKEADRLDPQAHTSHRPYATLAALRAGRGELSQAIAWQRKALACADHLDKEEKSKAALVLKLYQTRKKKADKAAPRRTERKPPPPRGDGQ
ncbi:MAG TPA: tetratricopeptide repeat protein [Gemmataceae bacterium]|jgi:tetratricopeptide (TPR) repeat protein